MTLLRVFSISALAVVITAGALTAQVDPGVRSGPAGAGTSLAGMTGGEGDFFNSHGIPQFTEAEGVPGGLGPRFNLDSCGGCHAQPALGGSSPAVNPQVANAAIMAPGNTVPSLLKLNGPIREVRFVHKPDGSTDGGVHGIFTITGRVDAPTGCAITQPDFSNTGNLTFRIPTPIFGGGLIESITETTIRQNLASDPQHRKALFGIKGHVNTNGNDGTITRFGWKAQNKSLEIFAGEAYNVEMGVTNDNFPNEREEDPNCATNGTPESLSHFNVGSTDPSDMLAFMGFMKFLDQPKPACTGSACSPSIQNGHNLFVQVGCVTCHTESLTSGRSSSAALSQQKVNLFSDLAVHHMGSKLADGVTQGSAGPDEFRTAPLWGVGQRIFFLHDGRTSDLLQAIQAHDSQGSEASRVVEAFQAILSKSQKQDILNFLRSL